MSQEPALNKRSVIPRVLRTRSRHVERECRYPQKVYSSLAETVYPFDPVNFLASECRELGTFHP